MIPIPARKSQHFHCIPETDPERSYKGLKGTSSQFAYSWFSQPHVMLRPQSGHAEQRCNLKKVAALGRVCLGWIGDRGNSISPIRPMNIPVCVPRRIALHFIANTDSGLKKESRVLLGRFIPETFGKSQHGVISKYTMQYDTTKSIHPNRIKNLDFSGLPHQQRRRNGISQFSIMQFSIAFMLPTR